VQRQILPSSSWRTVAKRRLHRVQLVALGDALDGGDAGASRLAGKHGARFHRAAVDMHDAGAALAGIAADMGAGEIEVIAQEMDEQRPILHVDRDGPAVHRQRDFRHV
jgi:hypothetical protein